MKKIDMSNKIESRISGIPCIIQIDEFNKVSKWKGSIMNCYSSDDYYGYYEIEFTVLDRKGYKADWLEKKMKDSDVERIQKEIIGIL